MPVQIGAKTHNFTDPTGLLSDCHRRIEMFMGTLEAVAAVIDRPPAEDTVRALESALRYFGEAAPKHTADEEVSLFPRLRQMGHPEMDSAFAELEHLEDEHRWSATLHADVERLGVQYLSMGKLSDVEIEKFRSGRNEPCGDVQAAHQHRGRIGVSAGSQDAIRRRKIGHR